MAEEKIARIAKEIYKMLVANRMSEKLFTV